MTTPSAVTLALSAVLMLCLAPGEASAGETRIPLTFEGGHETDPRDGGRPVALVAGALGVPPKVFREAFRGVRPAPAGSRPSSGQVRRNKEALLAVLGPRGVTNERLDRVSDYYRYNPGRGELWPVEPAAGYAVVRDGRLASVVVTRGGSGYNAPPRVSVAGHPEWALRASLAFGPKFQANGSVSSVTAAVASGGAR